MRSWVSRTAMNTARRAEEPRTRFARWTARWSTPAPPTVPASEFQGHTEPDPRHWRRPPASWVSITAADPAVQHVLAAALAELPSTWRAVVLARDVDQQSAPQVAERFGLTARQQRAILNRSRELLRLRLTNADAGS